METLKLESSQLSSLRDEAFMGLREAMPVPNREAALRCSVRLQDSLPRPRNLSENVVMVAYGGGKDSTYTLAFVRAIQLMLFRIHGATFRLRVVTNRQPGMPRAVLANINRVYQALQLTTDPGCELLLVDGDEVGPFQVDKPQRQEVIRRSRFDILMTGHRTFGDGRPTFCNACNISMVNSFGLAAAYRNGVHVIVTGDSLSEQRAYALWVRRLARKVDPGSRATRRTGFDAFLVDVDNISQSYFTEIYGNDGPDAKDAVSERRVTVSVPVGLRFFSIFEDTNYSAADHLELLTDHLGFEFDDLAFSFTETDCANPALMAHLRGLKCERMYGRGYDEGVAEYVEFALELMRKKEFPDLLVDEMRARYSGVERVAERRKIAQDFALEAYGLTEEQLVCMIYSPFAGAGAGLASYLEREQPRFASRGEQIRALLAEGPSAASAQLVSELEQMTGLTVDHLRSLYRSSVRRQGRSDGPELLEAMLAGDPHKGIIRTRHTHEGPVVLEQISGR